MNYLDLKREEELKNRIRKDYFKKYDAEKIIGNIDFCVALKNGKSLFWAEAKKGKADIYESIVQLILTIGKARTFDAHSPPSLLGAFDGEKIAFVHYIDIQAIFYINDFNWNVRPSDHESKEFQDLLKKVSKVIEDKSSLFYFERDNNEIKNFIKNNFNEGSLEIVKIQIDKTNFTHCFYKWLEKVKPSIQVNWDVFKKNKIIDGDFYLADLLSQEDKTLKEKLYVLLEKNHYTLSKAFEEDGTFSYKEANFNDNQKAHKEFWNKYERPPKKEYWDYIVDRRDLLVPQDIRERKGSFYTPRQWVELSQKYLSKALGEHWQEEYTVWDCAAGTGNLLNGLTNKYNLWASTIDKQDVDVMKDRIQNGFNLLEDQVFQFDFLNDDFSKLPPALKAIIDDPKKRKKLLIYINPPYAEAGNPKTMSGKKSHNKEGVSTDHQANQDYQKEIGRASNEVFALFMAVIYDKMPGSKLGQFSTLKLISGSNFSDFQDFFQAKFLKGFVARANTFDNVKGNFPIGFTIWDLDGKKKITDISCDVWEDENIQSGQKKFYADLTPRINSWIRNFDNEYNGENIGFLAKGRNDFQHQNLVFLFSKKEGKDFRESKINVKNLIVGSIYFTATLCIKADWLNDRDQFLSPNDQWKKDTEFQSDCLAFTLFHGQNRISSKDGTNHWIPFTEIEVNSRANFTSNFMTDFIAGKQTEEEEEETLLKEEKEKRTTPLIFSKEAKEVFDAGKKLWIYYHQKERSKPSASLYDIKEYFQGRNEKGRMNNKSNDSEYMGLIKSLRKEVGNLAEKIKPNIYKYEFLKS